jgi:phage terminase large subunit-like protein
MTDELDVSALHRSAELAMSNTEYRRKFERADFLRLNRFQRELLDAVSHNRFVLGRAGGQIGKSTVAMYVTQQAIANGVLPNRTPPRLERAHKFVVWILSESGQTTILGPQTRLIGAYPDAVGTGLLPLRSIKKCIGAHGVPGLISEVNCETDKGEPVIVRFRQYQQGKQALTSEGVDLIICDELPPDKTIWAELMQRVAATNGTILVVATPGRQTNDILHWFDEPGTSKIIVPGAVDDADHMTAQQKSDLAAHYRSISEAEYRSRYLGEPFVAGGRVFSFRPDDVYHQREIKQFGPATRWLFGADLGHGTGEGGHPTAFVLCAYDATTDRVYVCKTYRRNQVLPIDVWSAVRHWPHAGAPVAWGAAENQTSGLSRTSYKDLFKREGFRMLAEHARHPDGSVYIETSVSDIQKRLRNGTLLIHPDCQDLIRELLDLERDDDGKVLAIRDDLFAALRYALMCLKSAKSDTEIVTGLSAAAIARYVEGTATNSSEQGFDLFSGRPC